MTWDWLGWMDNAQTPYADSVYQNVQVPYAGEVYRSSPGPDSPYPALDNSSMNSIIFSQLDNPYGRNFVSNVAMGQPQDNWNFARPSNVEDYTQPLSSHVMPITPQQVGSQVFNLMQMDPELQALWKQAQTKQSTFERVVIPILFGTHVADPATQAQNRLNTLKGIWTQGVQQTALRPFKQNPAAIFRPKMGREYLEEPREDIAMSRSPAFIDTQSFTPEQKLAAEVLFNRKLEDTDPLSVARQRESIAWHKSLENTSAEKRAALQEEHERREAADKENARIREEGLRVRREGALDKAFEHGLGNEYDVKDIKKAFEAAYDPKTGNFDRIKFMESFPQGKTPKAARIEKEHAARIKADEERVAAQKMRARDLASRYKDSEGYRRYMAAAREFEQRMKVWNTDLSKLGVPFPEVPPDPDMFIGTSFAEAEGDGYKPKPAGSSVRRGAEPREDLDDVDRLIFGKGKK